jgi:hypothetical protein
MARRCPLVERRDEAVGYLPQVALGGIDRSSRVKDRPSASDLGQRADVVAVAPR